MASSSAESSREGSRPPPPRLRYRPKATEEDHQLHHGNKVVDATVVDEHGRKLRREITHLDTRRVPFKETIVYFDNDEVPEKEETILFDDFQRATSRETTYFDRHGQPTRTDRESWAYKGQGERRRRASWRGSDDHGRPPVDRVGRFPRRRRAPSQYSTASGMSGREPDLRDFFERLRQSDQPEGPSRAYREPDAGSRVPKHEDPFKSGFFKPFSKIFGSHSHAEDGQHPYSYHPRMDRQQGPPRRDSNSGPAKDQQRRDSPPPTSMEGALPDH